MKSKRLKLLLSLSCFMFCVVALCFGVYAATTATLTISGTITFEPYKMYVNSIKINSIDENGYVSNENLSGFNGLYLNDSSGLSTIDLGTQTVSQSGGLEIEIKFTSLDTTKYQKVTFSYTQPEGYEVRSTSTILKPNPQNLIQGDATGTFKIYISSETTTNLDISTLNLNIGFEDYGTSLLQHDTTNDYYVEMGTIPNQISGTNYESEYIRWKLIGTQTAEATSTSASQYARFDGTSAPSSGTTGVFILETNTLLERDDGTGYSLNEVTFNHSFQGHGSMANYYHSGDEWEEYDILANDYATSTVRQYINGKNNVYKAATYTSASGNTSSSVPNETSEYSNMYTDFCIDTENDIIYKAIIGRSLQDLYLGNGGGSYNGQPVDFPEQLTTLNKEWYTSSTIDKFWLLSYYEAYSLFLANTGGLQGQADSAEREWPNGATNYYWLRSPYVGRNSYAYAVGPEGNLHNLMCNVHLSSIAARAAFILSI